MTSLVGARTLLTLFNQYGIRYNNDDQLFGRMGQRVGRLICHSSCYKPNSTSASRPFVLGRMTNRGDIGKSRRISWSEMALLRIATNSTTATLPLYGNPPHTATRALERQWVMNEDRNRRINACRRIGLYDGCNAIQRRERNAQLKWNQTTKWMVRREYEAWKSHQHRAHGSRPEIALV